MLLGYDSTVAAHGIANDVTVSPANSCFHWFLFRRAWPRPRCGIVPLLLDYSDLEMSESISLGPIECNGQSNLPVLFRTPCCIPLSG